VNSTDREALAQRVLGFSNADQTEVLIANSDAALTRFTHDTIHQSLASRDVAISVRAIVDQRTGVAQTNLFTDAELRAVVRRAIAMAELAPKDPGQPRLPAGGSTSSPPGAFDNATALASADVRGEMVGTVFAVAQQTGYWPAGYASRSSAGYTIANSSGALASFDGTDAALNAKFNATDSTGYGEAFANAVAAIDAGTIAETAARKARDTAAPRAGEPGTWTVVLEPAAFGELMAFLAAHFSAQSFDEGSSFCSDGLDRSYFGENVTIRDDYAHPRSPGMPFDFEAQPTQRLALADAGVVRNIVTDSYWAHKLKRENTGHALPAPNTYGPQVRHLVVDGGTRSTDELIASIERGLLVSRLWYVRIVDQKRALLTGMTRDGTYLIENGKLSGGMRNMRFNQSLLDALRGCEFSNEQRRTGGYAYSVVVPAAKIDRFTFSSATEF
jgi:PmbA protein